MHSKIDLDDIVAQSLRDNESAASEESFRSLCDDANSAVSRDEYEDCYSPSVLGIVGNDSPAMDEVHNDAVKSYHHTATGGDHCVDHVHVVEEPEFLLEKAEAAKAAGNELFKQEDFTAAILKYDEALATVPAESKQRAVYHANLGACHLALKNWQQCAHSCSEALTIDDQYVKALRRRMAAYEQLDELDRALADANQILEVEPGDVKTRALAAKWEPVVKERQEKMKEEVLGKLKDLGNSVLNRFGMSLDNFKMDQDPESGGYSIRFQQ